MGRHEIVILDEDAERINECEANLRVALAHMNIDTEVKGYSEFPFLTRCNVVGYTPSVQIDGGKIWQHTIGKSITVQQFEGLFRRLRKLGEIDF